MLRLFQFFTLSFFQSFTWSLGFWSLKNTWSPEAVSTGSSQYLPFQSTVMGGSEKWLQGKGLSDFRADRQCDPGHSVFCRSRELLQTHSFQRSSCQTVTTTKLWFQEDHCSRISSLWAQEGAFAIVKQVPYESGPTPSTATVLWSSVHSEFQHCFLAFKNTSTPHYNFHYSKTTYWLLSTIHIHLSWPVYGLKSSIVKWEQFVSHPLSASIYFYLFAFILWL